MGKPEWMTDITHWLGAQNGYCQLDAAEAGPDQLGVLSVSGVDAVKFLQGQLTCDVSALATGAHGLGACCTPQGRMRALFRLVRTDSALLLLMPKSVVPLLLEALKKYAVFFKVVLRDASAEFRLLGLLGSAAEHLTGLRLSLPGPVSRQLLIQSADTPAPELSLPSPSRQQLPPLPTDYWSAAAILAGEPAVYPETVEKLLPHHVNLPALGGVSFGKGCYTGQEIVARMEYRGKIKTHMQLAYVATSAQTIPATNPARTPAGCPVRAGERDVGELVRSVNTEQGQLLLITLADPAMTAALQLATPEAPILELALPIADQG